jgi:hypothetical protein
MELDILNFGPQSNVTGVGQCEPKQAVARPRPGGGPGGSRFRKAIRVTTQTTTHIVRQGRNDNIRRFCRPPAQGFTAPESLSTGHELDLRTASVYASFPDAATTGTWNIFFSTTRPFAGQQVTLFLLCRSTGVGWQSF